MKKLILVFLHIATFSICFSQAVPSNVKSKGYYLNKSHHQKRISWIMLGGGAAFTAIGIGLAQAQSLDYALGNSKSGNTSNVLAVVGVASMLGSIPLFISAAHNKRKAAALAFNIQKVPILYTTTNRCTFQPILGVKFSLSNH